MTDFRAVLAAAIDYAKRGWSVIPVRGDKRPALKSWKRHQTKATPPEQVAAMFIRAGNGVVSGVGIVLGKASGGLVVRDFDDPDAYLAWADAHADLAATLPTVRTPSGGYHVYAKGGNVSTKVYSDGELRGNLAYVCAPPTVLSDSKNYEWINPLPPGELPSVDAANAGFHRSWREPDEHATESAEKTERTESAEKTESIETTESTDAMEVFGAALCEKIDDAIERTMPSGERQRNRKLFQFARRIKAMPEYRDADAAKLRPLVKRWHAAALPMIATQEFGVSWSEFVYGWPRVKIPHGADGFSLALARAESVAPPAWAAYYGPAGKLLASLCRELQRDAGAGPFFLSCRKAGEAIGLDATHAGRVLDALVIDGGIEVVEKGSAKSGRATRFRYVAPDLEAPGPPPAPNPSGSDLRNSK